VFCVFCCVLPVVFLGLEVFGGADFRLENPECRTCARGCGLGFFAGDV
jgi:hypothetical protein